MVACSGKIRRPVFEPAMRLRDKGSVTMFGLVLNGAPTDRGGSYTACYAEHTSETDTPPTMGNGPAARRKEDSTKPSNPMQ